VKRLRPEQDAFGRVLLERLDGNARARIVIERDDGYMDAEDAAAYFDGVRKWFRVERQALRYVRGRVLDVGVGAGRVALELQHRGREVVAIDVSPLAIRVARRRGVRKTKVLAFEDLDDSLGTFDTIVFFMNNFGLFASASRAKRMLRRLHSLTTDRGRIVLTSSDIRHTRNRDHRAYQRRNLERGRMRGQIRLRLRYGLVATPWFDYLFVSPPELETLARGTDWHVRRVMDKDGSDYYAAVLEKDSPR
jgi:SAM-dependent methyltransferase